MVKWKKVGEFFRIFGGLKTRALGNIIQYNTKNVYKSCLLYIAGPRVCLGEPLARYSTLLLFTALLQHFQFSVPPHEEPPSTEQLEGFTTSPAPYVVAVKRVE
jgi:cytochrome P450